jgi:LysR family transcriptional regulator, glycine cleavage system transcriptional activator
MRPSLLNAPLNALRAFEAAARHLSFKNAATELHVTAGAVSHQVKLLEDYLGVVLFRRLTRALELTAEGQAMLGPLREGLMAIARAIEAVRVSEDATALTVIAPPAFTARWLVPRLASFTRANPSLELHLASRSAMIDTRDHDVPLTTEDEREDTPTVMVRFGTGDYPGMHVDEMFSAVYTPVCSPLLARGKPGLARPADLRHHTLLHDETRTEEGARPSWAAFLEATGVEGVDATRGPHFSNASLAIDAAIEGMGVVLAMKPLVSADVAAHRLVIPFDLAAPTRYSYYLVLPEHLVANRAVAAFREWLLAESARERGES